MIEVENLHKRFGEVAAVEDVSFSAADGEVTGLLGPNGAGKTTSLRMLYTLLPPDRGSAQVDGFDSVHGARTRSAGALGVLSDAKALYPRLTAREHLQLLRSAPRPRGRAARAALRGADGAAGHASRWPTGAARASARASG